MFQFFKLHFSLQILSPPSTATAPTIRLIISKSPVELLRATSPNPKSRSFLPNLILYLRFLPQQMMPPSTRGSSHKPDFLGNFPYFSNLTIPLVLVFVPSQISHIPLLLSISTPTTPTLDTICSLPDHCNSFPAVFHTSILKCSQSCSPQRCQTMALSCIDSFNAVGDTNSVHFSSSLDCILSFLWVGVPYMPQLPGLDEMPHLGHDH